MDWERQFLKCAEDRDAALAREAALREELASNVMTIQELAGANDELQQRLTAAEHDLAVANHEIEARISAEVGAIEALQAAEHRNAETSASLQLATRLLASGLSALSPRAGLAKNVRAFLDSQRKPTESGASE